MKFCAHNDTINGIPDIDIVARSGISYYRAEVSRIGFDTRENVVRADATRRVDGGPHDKLTPVQNGKDFRRKRRNGS